MNHTKENDSNDSDKNSENKKTPSLKIAAAIIGGVLLAFIIFALGLSVGLHKGKFSCNFGKNYEKNFMGSKMEKEHSKLMSKFMDRFEGKGFRNAHGLAGSIISITDDKIIIKDQDEKENTVAVTEKTIIKSQRNNLKITDLKQDDKIVVMGTPDESGVINADLIRVFKIANN